MFHVRYFTKFALINVQALQSQSQEFSNTFYFYSTWSRSKVQVKKFKCRRSEDSAMKTQVKAFAAKPRLEFNPWNSHVGRKANSWKLFFDLQKCPLAYVSYCGLRSYGTRGAAPEWEWGQGMHKPQKSHPEIGRSSFACLLSWVPPTPGGHVAW